MKRLFLVGLALCSGCVETEHWHSSDAATLEVEVEVDGVVEVDATVVTTPNAYPRDLYSNALRVLMENEQVAFVGEVIDGEVSDDPRDIDDHWGDNVNVLDAWDDCPRDADCERSFRFELSCADETEACNALVEADAFLSTLGLRPEKHRGGKLILELSLVED